ncbi:MAG: transcriptional regulator [Clostridium sp.]|nr:transcriptional regulator [Clostridium sp.]
MSNTNNYEEYKVFLCRLIQYRRSHNMTQEETGCLLGITQSQFSKMELGKTIVPYSALKRFKQKGWDIDWLFTGKETISKASELSDMIDGIREEDRKELLRVIVWLLEEGIRKCTLNISFESKCEIEILRMRATGGEKTESVLHEVRKIAGMAQIPMAEKLGVNIKKYRRLEKEELKPDAELLLRIYKTTGCKPSLLLDDTDVEKLIINDLWNDITPPVRKKILSLAEQIKAFLKM